MKRRHFLKGTTLGAAGLACASSARANLATFGPRVSSPAGSSRSVSSPVKTILSFATEAAHALEDFDFIRDIALFLTSEKLVGNFHLTGDYARALKRHGRHDVVEALRPHEIGYHCNHHGSRPFMPGYLENQSWDEGVTRWLGYEAPGLALVAELMNRRPTYYTTEFSKAPQAIHGATLLGTAMLGYGAVPMREHSAVWFCNCFIPSVENIVALESFHAPGDREKVARERLDAGVAKQQAAGKDVLRVFLHSYKYYSEPPHDRLTMTLEIYKDDTMYFEDYPNDWARQPVERFRASFEMFKRSIRHHAKQSQFVGMSEYRDGFQPNTGRWLELPEVDRLARHLGQAIDAYSTPEYSISPAEALGVFARLARVWSETRQLPSRVFIRNVIGPRAALPADRPARQASWADVIAAARWADRDMEISGAIPVEVSLGGAPVGPGQLLRALLSVYDALRRGRPAEQLSVSGGELPTIAAEPYFQMTTFNRPGLYPVGFTGQNICAISKAQSWSWKPAVRRQA